MTNAPGVVYEVSLAIEQDVVEEFDSWLPVHIDEMLAIAGFIEARTFTLENDDKGRAQRVTHYHLESEADLERYLAGPASSMRQSVTDRFGDQFEASRRILHLAHPAGSHATSLEYCLNCKSTLAGQYCATCGQRARSRLISLWELISDAFGDLFELDSRLWRTLIPLFAKPGVLTRDYLEGRRARFMPPFRTYLVLSIIFFLIAFFDPRQDLQILFEPDEPANTDVPAPSEVGEPPKTREEITQEVLDELAAEGIIVDDFQLDKLQTGVVADDSTADQEEDDSPGVSIKMAEGGKLDKCEFEGLESAELPPWLAKRLTKDRLQKTCDRVVANDGRDFLRALLDKIPAALFFLLPLMALVLKILYPLSKRYYVEHLLFVVHFHAFFFLILTLQVLLSRIGPAVAIPSGITTASVVAISFYIPVYLYKAMRRVYSQKRFITFLKFSMLVLAYVFGFSLVLVLATLITAFSI